MRIAILLLLTTTAGASPYKRKQDLQIPVVHTAAVDKPAPQPSRARPIDATTALATEEALEPLKKQQEEILEGLARDTPDTDPDKPDYLFRLAEQYARGLRLWRLRATELEISAGVP